MVYRRLAVLLLLLPLLYGCPPKPKPPQPPEPPKPIETGRPTAPVALESLVRTEGGRFTIGGKPAALHGAIPCWPPDGTGDVLKVEGRVIPYLWPLVSPEWIEHASSKGANAFHVRPGPVHQANLCCGLEAIGPPIKLDGTENPKFWETFHAAGRATVKTKTLLEVDVLDTWIIKHAIWGEVQSPLNVQTAMNVPLSSDVKAWTKKVVYESCNYGNVVYQLANESSQTPGWTPAWESAMYREIRAAEQQEGCGQIVHVIGSDAGMGDYEVSHNPAEGLAGARPIPVSVNEYNPHLAPVTVAGKVCEAKANNQGYWYWRSDGSDADQDQTLLLMDQGCAAPPVASCPDPKPDRDKLVIQLAFNLNSWDATPIVTQSCEYCREIGMGEMGGQIRCSCPMRNEGDPNRLNCEQYVLQAPHPVWTSDGEIQYMDANGFRVKSNGTWLKACDFSATHCTEVVP